MASEAPSNEELLGLINHDLKTSRKPNHPLDMVNLLTQLKSQLLELKEPGPHHPNRSRRIVSMDICRSLLAVTKRNCEIAQSEEIAHGDVCEAQIRILFKVVEMVREIIDGLELDARNAEVADMEGYIRERSRRHE